MKRMVWKSGFKMTFHKDMRWSGDSATYVRWANSVTKRVMGKGKVDVEKRKLAFYKIVGLLKPDEIIDDES